MGRVKGRGKKQNNADGHEDARSGDEEKIPLRRRGRPQKPLKDDVDEEEEVEIIQEEEDRKIVKGPVLGKLVKKQAASENGRKRKRASPTKESVDLVKEENGIGTKADELKTVSSKQNSSRRKNKPRRAAEVGVECK